MSFFSKLLAWSRVFFPLHSNDIILGAIGVLQFDVVAYRLKNEYNVECAYDTATMTTARWVTCDDKKMLEDFKNKTRIDPVMNEMAPTLSDKDIADISAYFESVK